MRDWQAAVANCRFLRPKKTAAQKKSYRRRVRFKSVAGADSLVASKCLRACFARSSTASTCGAIADEFPRLNNAKSCRIQPVSMLRMRCSVFAGRRWKLCSSRDRQSVLSLALTVFTFRSMREDAFPRSALVLFRTATTPPPRSHHGDG